MSTTQIMITAFGLLFVIGNSLGLGLTLQIGRMLSDFFRHWHLAARVLLINFVILPALIIGFAALRLLTSEGLLRQRLDHVVDRDVHDREVGQRHEETQNLFVPAKP
jgi:hypothetical protein